MDLRGKELMRRRTLNLNQSGLVFVGVIGFLMVLIPGVSYGILLVWNKNGIIRDLLVGIKKASFVLGAVVLVVFLVLIVVEQVQDHYFDTWYQKQRSQKVVLANGYYECQYCGNQRVRENDSSCNVCGREFQPGKGN
jgi:uncharacterized paraquat-inducible protein A